MATPRNAAAAAIRKHQRNAFSVGSTKEPKEVLSLVSTVAMTAAANVVPMDRIKAFSPTAEAAS